MYDKLLKFLKPFVIAWGKIHWPFTHKKITGAHYFSWRGSIEIGTVLLTKTNGEFSNIINPVKIKHAGIYVGDIHNTGIRYVFEATGKGAVLTDLVTFLTTKDMVIGCRPIFIRDKKAFSDAVQQFASKSLGVPYDYLFNTDKQAYYCFELAAAGLKYVYSELQLKCKTILKGKRIYDHDTFLDPEFFEIVFDSRNK